MVSTERGDTVTLTCGSLGGPENTFSWVQPPSNTPLSSEASLNVSVSSGRDGGVYICSVRNEAGNDSTDAIINGNEHGLLLVKLEVRVMALFVINLHMDKSLKFVM